MTLKRAKNDISRLLTSHRIFNDFSHNQFYSDCSWVGSYKNKNITTEITSSSVSNAILLKKKERKKKMMKQIPVQCIIKFLNSLKLHDVPPHRLQLKIWMPIMLLKNIKLQMLCYGTFLSSRFFLQVTDATILNWVGECEMFIPEIPIIPWVLPFEWK